MIRAFQGTAPVIAKSAFIEESAAVIGDVVVGEDSSVWFHAVLRGDIFYIRVGERTNIQDHCVLHVRRNETPTILGNEITVGHRVILHACTVKDRVLVGMGSIILDGVVIGEDSIIGAGTLLTQGTVIPPRSLVLGSPGKVRRAVTDQELQWIKTSADHYVTLARKYRT